MNPRYPAPEAGRIFSLEARANRMRHITDMYLIDLVENKGGPSPYEIVRSAPDIDLDVWKHFEKKHGHEIVGFLDAYMVGSRMTWDLCWAVHFGLTSSDLVEYDLHQSIREHAQQVAAKTDELAVLLGKMRIQYGALTRAGRTHGQTAAKTLLGHQFDVFYSTLSRLLSDLGWVANQNPIKSAGPTGCYTRSNPPGAGVVTPSTQIIPRDFLLRWASSYLLLSNTLETMAMFVRTGARSEIGEFKEGATEGRVGSSAMPGKANPIDSEKVCGLARVVRGHFLSLAEVSALWEDRDLSNSSTERIAVPDLAATVEHMLDTTYRVFRDLVIDQDRITRNAADPRCTIHLDQMEIQEKQRVGPIEASRLANERNNNGR